MSNNIDLYIQELEDSKVEIKRAIIAKGVTPTGGLSSYADAVKMIPTGGNSKMLPLSKTITENGEYEYNPINDGVDGYSRVSMNVDIPIPTFETQSKEVTIKTNGTTSIVPDSGYDGLSEVNVTVQVSTGGSDKPQILNGFAFNGGDISQVDFSQYDWSMVYDTSSFFEGCTHSTGDWSNFQENFNGDVASVSYMFGGKNISTSSSNNVGVSSLPNLGEMTKDLTSTAYMCCKNSYLNDVSALSSWNTSKVTDATNMFGYGTGGVEISNLNIKAIDLTGFGSPEGFQPAHMFNNCRTLESVRGNLKLKGDASSMFRNCYELAELSEMDTSNVTKMNNMFMYCGKLTSIHHFDTSNVTDMSNMFYNCNLTSIPHFDTSNVTNMTNMLRGCDMTTIPQFNTSNVTNMSNMFEYCQKLTSIPQLDVSKVTNFQYMFQYCSELTTLPDFNSVKTTNFGNSYNVSWLSWCPKIEKIGVVNCDSVTNINYFFGDSSRTYLTEFGGCMNLGKASSVSNTNSSYFMPYAPNLNYQSVLNVLNGLYDRASAGLSVLTLKLHANHLAMLSEDDIAIATNKGWTIV